MSSSIARRSRGQAIEGLPAVDKRYAREANVSNPEVQAEERPSVAEDPAMKCAVKHYAS